MLTIAPERKAFSPVLVVPTRLADARRTATPNATMTTLASPTLGASVHLSLWTVEMDGGQRGPIHVFDSEQVWMVLHGDVSIVVNGQAINLSAGDTVVLPGGVTRQITAESQAHLVVCGCSAAIVSVPGEADSRGTPPWIS